MSKPGRPQKAVSPAAGHMDALVAELRGLRLRSGLTCRDLAAKAGLSLATVSAAASGRSLPTWRVTRAYTDACQGDVLRVRELWEAVATDAGRTLPGDDFRPPGDPPDPASATGPAGFVELLRELRAWAGSPSLSDLNKLSRDYLPPSTVSDNLRKNRLPRRDFVTAFALACGLGEDQVRRWEDVWADLKSRETSRPGPGGNDHVPGAWPPDPSRAARALRKLVPVDETILDQVPGEREKYTRLGTMILCAAMVSALTVAYALHDILAAPWTIAAGAATLALSVVGAALDHSIILRARAVPGRTARLRITVPRVLVALVVAFLVAEPLAVTVFHSAVSQQLLKNDIAELNTRRTALLNEIGQVTVRLNELESAAARACAGTRGRALDCQSVKERENQYISRIDLPDMEDRISAVSQEMASLSTSVSTLISGEAARARPQKVSAGLLDQAAALQDLPSGKGTVVGVQLLLVTFIATVILLPFAREWLMPPTAYDKLVRQRLDDYAKAAEAKRNAVTRQDLADITQLAGQVNDLTERLPRLLAGNRPPDVRELRDHLSAALRCATELTS